MPDPRQTVTVVRATQDDRFGPIVVHQGTILYTQDGTPLGVAAHTPVQTFLNRIPDTVGRMHSNSNITTSQILAMNQGLEGYATMDVGSPDFQTAIYNAVHPSVRLRFPIEPFLMPGTVPGSLRSLNLQESSFDIGTPVTVVLHNATVQLILGMNVSLRESSLPMTIILSDAASVQFETTITSLRLSSVLVEATAPAGLRPMPNMFNPDPDLFDLSVDYEVVERLLREGLRVPSELLEQENPKTRWDLLLEDDDL